MIREIANIRVRSGHAQAFEQGVAQARALFERAKGCGGVQLHRQVEEPLCYTLVVQWDSVEDHMVHFRESSDFQQWRALVAEYFDGAPAVHHVQQVL